MASTSARGALRLVASMPRSVAVAGTSVSRAIPQARAMATSRPRQQADDDNTPARSHRSPSPTTSGGPDVEPLSGQPQNASTEAALTRGQRSARDMADFAQGLIDPQSAQQLQAQQQQQQQQQQLAWRTPTLNTDGQSAVPYTPEALAQRTDPLLEAFVNNLMRDGKKAQATSHICDMLDHLAQAFHADPLPALHAAVEAASPLVRMQTRKGGGKNVQVPVALRAEQSRRKGIVAILDASKKRNDRKLATRLAREVIAVLEGTSSTLAKKEEAHKVAMLNRSNASVRI